MTLRDRVARVSFKNTATSFVEENNLKFSITKSAKKEENRGSIILINNQNRNSLGFTGGTVLVEAGYLDEGISAIHFGDVLSISTKKSSTDYYTSITSFENYLGDLNKISVNLPKKANIKDLFSTIAQQSNLNVGYISQTFKNKKLETGYTNYGTTSSVLNQLATEYDFVWTCQDSSLYVVKQDDKLQQESMHFDYSSGLLEDPYIEVTQDVFGTKIPTWTIKTLLTPSLKVNTYISINSNTLVGQKKIYRITHTGSLRDNEWFSTIKVFE